MPHGENPDAGGGQRLQDVFRQAGILVGHKRVRPAGDFGDLLFDFCESIVEYKADVVKAYGLVYELIRNDVPVYWVIDSGKQAVDADSNQVGQMLSARLGIPQACFASKVEVDPATNKAVVRREVDGGIVPARAATVGGKPALPADPGVAEPTRTLSGVCAIPVWRRSS